MESYNQSINESYSNDTDTEAVPLFVTYLYMVTTLISSIIVITPAMIVINVIWQIQELHTKYFFFVIHLLATDVIWRIVADVLLYIVIILYLLDLNSDSVVIVLKWLGVAPTIVLYLMVVLSPITVAVERVIVIAFPFRHRSIMTKKTVAYMLSAMWWLSTILTIMIIIILPFDIFWPLALFHWPQIIYAIIGVSQLISIICIVAANSVLQYKITISNRKAAENQRLGNEEEVKRFKKLLKEVRVQAKATITLFLVGGISITANILQTVAYAVIEASVESNKKLYILLFSYQLIETYYFLSRALVYGLYMKKIRNRLPNWMVCYRQCWITRHNRVGILHQQPQRRVNTVTK